MEAVMSDKTFEVTEANFQKEVLESTEPVLIDFWAEWCTPCKMIGPLVDQIADEYIAPSHFDQGVGTAAQWRP